MIDIINFNPEATKDYLDSLKWYGEKSIQAASNFNTELFLKIDLLKSDPWQARKDENGYREIKLNKFPFKIIYKVGFNTITIFAVYHLKIKPEGWIK